MPFSSNSGGSGGGSGGGGPWGGSGGSGGSGGGGRGKSPWGGGNGGGGGGGNGGGGGGGGPDLEDILRQGRDRLRVVLGGGRGRGGRPGGGGGGGGIPSGVEKVLPIAIPVVALIAWATMSFYTVKPEEKSVELFLGSYSSTGEPGLNFAPWPLVTFERLPVTREQLIDVGRPAAGARRGDAGLMLTGDENIIDIEFQVVWNIVDPAKFLFNLADAEATIRAVSESAMREVIARSEMKPTLNRDRGVIAQQVLELIQSTLDSYDAGVNIIRVNLERVDPPEQVIDAFKDVQAAAQDRVTEENRAEAYRNEVLARARGEAARIMQEAEAYRARVVNEAKGETARFIAVLEQYEAAPEVTRQRLYLETVERVLGTVPKIIIDEEALGGAGGAQGIVPYLPLNELRRGVTGENQ